MRVIDDEMLDLIAGGSSDASIPSVTIVGYRNIGGEDWVGGGGYAGSAGGSAPVSGIEPQHDCTPVHTSPVPVHHPTDVDMDVLRNTMNDVAQQIRGMNTAIEHGAIVVRSADGTLRVGEITDGTSDEISMAIIPQPGDTIVAYIHSHPANNLNQTLPSRYDFDQAASLRASPLADKAMMAYILDNASGDVFEYHADTPRNTTRTGANISQDVKPCP